MIEEVFEQQLVKEFIFNEKFFYKAFDLVKEKYFTKTENKLIIRALKEFYKTNSKKPTPKEFLLFAKNFNFDKFKEKVSNVLKIIYKDNTQISDEVLEKEFLKFIKKIELSEAIMESVDIIQADGDFNQIVGKIEEALSIDIETDIGLDYKKSLKERYEYYHTALQGIPTGNKQFDHILGGGFREKTLSVYLAPSHGGKTAKGIDDGVRFLLKGEDVLHITLELPEKEIAKRYDQNILKATGEELKHLSIEEMEKRIPKNMGELIIKEYPAGSFTTLKLQLLLKELNQKGFDPKIIIIDYLGIMNSSRVSIGKVGGYLFYKSISEELHGFAKEYNKVIITFHQFGRGGFDNLDANATDIADSIGIFQTADVAIALLSNEELRKDNKIMLKFIKNRFTGDLSHLIMNVDFRYMTFWEDESEVPEDVKIEAVNQLASLNPVSKTSTEDLANGFDFEIEE